ncbi:hypothetical protein AGDE_09339 [Angomonas deanei]|uniref:SH3 domain/Variant SH3 domain containing protein, putative n=1 Tax=Angomonas deanei TaxID=59799 RepID=A0A7G2CAM9_9TRYP|nr:hypothetical protein AGDE_09339 [Angomonas deanei]CAD2216846.1 SH3 domain/Variant SH3 domain containing protein, putative [Angomonas deanei]|eukprot:EPY30642.1 hypothetical protein AGDE_09339 [Angomonas deanei]
MAEEQCIALFDYELFSDDEISFSKGDVINVMAKGGASGFWKGYVFYSQRTQSYSRPENKKNPNLNTQQIAKCGLFPSCFVTSNMNSVLCEGGFCDKAVTIYSRNSKDENKTANKKEEGKWPSLSFEKGEVLTVLGPSHTPGWWVGVRERPLTAHATRYSSRDYNVPSLFPIHYVSCDIVLAVFDFDGRGHQELSLHVGDVLLVHRRWNDGWWEGTVVASYDLQNNANRDEGNERKNSGVRIVDTSLNCSSMNTSTDTDHGGHAAPPPLAQKRGIFPSNYTIPNVAQKEPPFFCQRCKTILSYYHDNSQHGNLFPSSVDPMKIPLSQGECVTCRRHKIITERMYYNLESFYNSNNHTEEDLKSFNLFANIDVLPTEEKENRKDGKKESNEEGTAAISCRHGNKKGDETLFSLLSHKDIVEVNSNRVKFEKEGE